MKVARDVSLAVLVILIVVMMVVPLNAVFLDVLLALNFSLALVIVLVSMYIKRPLDFSVFPALLLIATLYRLSLNISSTRLILLHGYAGQIIARFGEFVVGGNPVVGLIVFLILVIIQFVVITRGAERVAEVAARFTLDAMPGKQMSIDADLSAGQITDEEARARRREVAREADFYGAMDGASKFVKGDAIAGLIITVINLIGGFIVGMVQRGMDLSTALMRYSLLTVGDGLVSQIPALLVSVATGIVVTRAASEDGLGSDMFDQLLSNPRPLAVASAALFLLGLIPGLPFLPFFVMSFSTGIFAVSTSVRMQKSQEQTRAEGEADLDAWRKPENMKQWLQVDALEIELGYSLLSMAQAERGGDLLDRVVMIRRQIALEMGFIIPPIRIRDNVSQLKPSEYVIRLRGARVAGGELRPGYLLVLSPEGNPDDYGALETREPTFGLPAWWVPEESRAKAETDGLSLIDPTSVLATHLVEVIRTHAHELLGRQEVQGLLDIVKETHPALVEELIPGLLSLGEVQKVLQRLLQEGVPIRDLVTILESLADGARESRDPVYLTEIARQALKRQITRLYDLDTKKGLVITLDPDLERRLSSPDGPDLTPQEIRLLYTRLSVLMENVARRGELPMILCTPHARPRLRQILSRLGPKVAVLSFSELLPEVEVESVGVVSVT